MADKKRKSQAEKAATAAKKKKKSATTKTAKKNETVKTETKENRITNRLISSVIFLGTFVLLLVIFFQPEGALVKAVENLLASSIRRATSLKVASRLNSVWSIYWKMSDFFIFYLRHLILSSDT